jgi:alkanesulfonate monooxygenase SsuD/methylene tetrahydromethanopterin reductase-like flavin-dependent oxidoreductase (luciferase family)
MQFGVFLAPHGFVDTKSPTQLYDEALEQAQCADECGFDYVWLAEHDIVRYIITTDLLQLAVLIAQRTKRIRIGGAVFVTAFYHPLGLAGDIAQADHLTRGRFEPGLGRGGSPYELRQFQAFMPEADSRARFAEFVDIVRTAWEQDQALEFHGRFFDFNNAFVTPRPYSTPHPRIWLAAITPESVRFATERRFDVLFTAFRRPMRFIEEAHQAYLGAGGPQPGSHGPTQFVLNRNMYLAPTMEEAKEVLPLIRYHDKVVGAGRIDAERVVDGMRVWDERVQLGSPDEEYLRNLPIGDPDTVLERIAAYKALGIDQFSIYTAVGQDQRLVLRSMELFAKHVIPVLR